MSGRPRKRSFVHRCRSVAEYMLGSPLLYASRAIPESWVPAFGGFLGRCIGLCSPARRSIAETNIALAFPELSPKERRRLLGRSLAFLGTTMTEIARLPSLSDDTIRERIDYEGEGVSVIESDRPVIFFTGHFGNWELLALAHSLHGHPMHLVTRRLYNPIFNRMMWEMRTRGGNTIVQRSSEDEDGIHELLACLRRGGTVGVLVDQYASRKHAVRVPFFGRMAWSHRGPALLAVRSRAALVPAFIRRDPDNPRRHRVHLGAPIEGDRSLPVPERIEALTARMQEVVEAEVRARPDHWLWLHRRWKRVRENDALYAGEEQRRRRRGRARQRAAL